MLKRKFRWMIQFLKDGVALADFEYIKIRGEPACPIPYPPGVVFEFGFYDLWRAKDWVPTDEDFNEFRLRNIVHVDDKIEFIREWTFKGSKFLSLRNMNDCASDLVDNMDVYDGVIRYNGNITYSCNEEFHERFFGE